MRISTNTVYNTATSKMMDLQASQARLQTQISTGKRILNPSDDPIAASRALAVSQAQSVNNQFVANRQIAQTQLSSTETALSGVSDLILSMQSLIAGAGNGTLNNSDRNSIATELQVSLDQLVSLANTRDSVGNYLFSGYETKTAPFTRTATGASYNGDSNKQELQISPSRLMAVTETGADVFQANGNDIFETLVNLVNVLQTPVTDAASATALTAGLETASSSLQAGLDSVLTARSAVGSKLKELDTLNEFSTAADLVYQQNLSDLQDLDYTKAISELAKQQTILEAAQKSFVKTTSLSLFEIL